MASIRHRHNKYFLTALDGDILFTDSFLKNVIDYAWAHEKQGSFQNLSYAEREKIQAYAEKGFTTVQISNLTKKARGTISKELSRCGGIANYNALAAYTHWFNHNYKKWITVEDTPNEGNIIIQNIQIELNKLQKLINKNKPKIKQKETK